MVRVRVCVCVRARVVCLWYDVVWWCGGVVAGDWQGVSDNI